MKIKIDYIILLTIILIYVLLSSRLTLILWSDESAYLKSYLSLNKGKHGPFMYYFNHIIFLMSKVFTSGDIIFYIYLYKIVGIVFGIFTLILIFLITEEIYDRQTALLSTFLCATMPMFIQIGKSIIFEMPQLFFICITLYTYIIFCKRKDTKLLFFLALFTMVSFLIKISCLAPIIPILFDCISKKRDKRVLIYLSTAILLGTIINLLYSDYYINVVIYGHALYMETLNPFVQLNYYAKILHPIGLVLFLFALFFCIFSRDEYSEFLLSYILITFWFLAYFRADSLDIARPHFIFIPMCLIVMARFIVILINKIQIKFNIKTIQNSNFLFFLLFFSLPIFHDILIKSLGYLPSYELSETKKYFFIEPYMLIPFFIYGLLKRKDILKKESYNSILLILFLFFLIPGLKSVLEYLFIKINVLYSNKILFVTFLTLITIIIVISKIVKNVNLVSLIGVSCIISLILFNLHLDIENLLFDTWLYNYALTEENLVGYNEYIGKTIPYIINNDIKNGKIGASHVTFELLYFFHDFNITYIENEFYMNPNAIKNLIRNNVTYFVISYRNLNPSLYGLKKEYENCFPVEDWARYHCLKSTEYENCIQNKVSSNKICAGVFSINASYFTS